MAAVGYAKFTGRLAVCASTALPAVRAAGPDTLIVTDGFSCRSQIAHGSDRRALHLAQVLQLALRGDATAPQRLPERAVAHHA